MKAIIGIGSNLGERESLIDEAIEALDRIPKTRVEKTSSIYETAPVGVEGHPDYLNAAAVLETELSPEAILGACFGIEASAGRVRAGDPEKKLPRPLDLDLLMYGMGEEHITRNTPELTLPHPRISERAFVLVPLEELFPGKSALGLDFSEEIEAVRGQRILIYRRSKRI